MNLSKKILIATLAASLPMGMVIAEQKTDAESKASSPILDAGISVKILYDLNNADEDNAFDDLDDTISINDLSGFIDVQIPGSNLIISAVLEARSNSWSQFDSDDVNEDDFIKELTATYTTDAAGNQMIFIVGKQSSIVGAGFTDAIEENSLTNTHNEANDRMMGVLVSVSPTAKSSSKIARAASMMADEIQIQLLSGNRDGETDFGRMGDAFDLESYAVKVKKQVGNYKLQASYMSLESGETQTSISGATTVGGVNLSVEHRAFEDYGLDSDLNSITSIRAQRALGPVDGYARLDFVDSENADAKDRATVGIEKDFTKNLTVSGEYQTDLDDMGENNAVMVQAKFHASKRGGRKANPIIERMKKYTKK